MSARSVDAKTGLSDLAARAGEVNRRQAGSLDLLPATRELVTQLGEWFESAPGLPVGAADPDDELVFARALIAAQLAVAAADRRSVRVALQRLQDALVDIVAHDPVREGRDANEVARWLSVALVDVSRQRVADMLGVDRRTFTRWVAEDATRPMDDDARRLRTVARTVRLLLGGLTAPGAVLWFELPNPELGGRSPVQELAQPDGTARLERAASALVSGDAS